MPRALRPAHRFDRVGRRILTGVPDMPDVNGVAGERLRSFIERIERLEEEKKALAADIKEVYAEAKGVGFDTKTMRQVVKLRKIDKEDLDEQEALLDVYLRAIGMKPDFPEGKAAE
jgi:uncharacterized protein (UPF0335 family)